MLRIESLKANIGEKELLKGINLTVPKGEIHVIMGPNGVGKSTLGNVLMGHKAYTQTAGQIYLNDENITELNTSERALKGLFLAFQYPVAVPGLRISEYLRNLYCLRHGQELSVADFRKVLRQKLDMLNIERSATTRYLNDGFSGGEMKRLEMLQLALVAPKLAILDEIDSGVDVDAQKTLAEAILRIRESEGTSFLIITHYQRLLNFLKPDKVHVVLNGKIERSGGLELVTRLEEEGYDWFRTTTAGGANTIPSIGSQI